MHASRPAQAGPAGHEVVRLPEGRRLRLTPVGFLGTQVAQAPEGECPYVLLLGAGASTSSGVPTVSALVDRWKRELFAHQTGGVRLESELFPEEAYRAWESTTYAHWLAEVKEYSNAESEYGTLFQFAHKTREQRQMFVERLIGSARPGLGYFYLAGLVTARRFNTVLTTNFDDLLNDALIRYFDQKAIVCAFDSAVSSFSSSTLRPKIIKLHGDFLFDNIRSTDSETLDLGENMEDKMVELCEDKGLIVVGYSGRDESVMAPLRENLRKNRKFLTKGVHWCIWGKEPRGGSVSEGDIDPRLAALQKRHPDRVFLYHSTGFDELMLQVFEGCGLQLPDGVLFPYSRNLARDFFGACSEYEVDNRLNISMRTHREAALASLREAPETVDLEVMRADTLFSAGVAAREDEDWDTAVVHFREALEMVEGVLGIEGLPPSVRWLAMRRKLGCLVALGKAVAPSTGMAVAAESRELWRSAVEACLSAEAPPIQPGGYGWEDGYVSALYNAVCACGLLHEAEEDGEAVLDTARRLIARLRARPTGRRKVAKLRSDPDVVLLVDAGLLDE